MANKQMTEAEAIQALNRLLSEQAKTAGTAATGACVYNAGGKTYCAEISKSACDTLHGAWTEGGKCP
jgi:hypothetical protein